MSDKPGGVADAVGCPSSDDAGRARFLRALEASHQGFWDWELESGQTALSPSYYAMLGFRPGDFAADHAGWMSLVHDDDLPELKARLERVREPGTDQFELDVRMRHRDAGWRWIHASGVVVERDAGGRARRLVGINADVTHRRLADVALQESEARFRAIFDNIQEAIFIQELDTGAILAVNRRACEMFGRDEVDILALSVEDLSAGVPPYTQADAAYWMMRAAAGQPQNFEWQSKRADGQLFWVEITMRRALLAGHERLLVVARDISQRKAQEQVLQQNLERQVQLNKRLEEAQSQLLQSEKMASIGQLAAGIAHELNNPIGFVSSNLGTLDGYLKDLFALVDHYETIDTAAANCADLLREARRLTAEKDYAFVKSDTAQLMAESRDGLYRVRKIVQDLKDFSRVGDLEWQWADIHAGIDSTLNIVWNELKYKCKVTKAYGELPSIYCLPSQLNQVFMNLLVNAGQAIQTQGEITIRTGREAEQVWVEITDTGSGIPPENLTRIFDPFFTTKPVGKGTGLGLSLSYSIVLKHRGRINVSSEVGRGSTFRVTLPIQPRMERTEESES